MDVKQFKYTNFLYNIVWEKLTKGLIKIFKSVLLVYRVSQS